MRRAIILFLSGSLLMAGCGGGGDGDDGGGVDQPTISGMLRQVRSAAELEESLKSSLPEVASPAAFPLGGE